MKTRKKKELINYPTQDLTDIFILMKIQRKNFFLLKKKKMIIIIKILAFYKTLTVKWKEFFSSFLVFCFYFFPSIEVIRKIKKKKKFQKPHGSCIICIETFIKKKFLKIKLKNEKKKKNQRKFLKENKLKIFNSKLLQISLSKFFFSLIYSIKSSTKKNFIFYKNKDNEKFIRRSFQFEFSMHFNSFYKKKNLSSQKLINFILFFVYSNRRYDKIKIQKKLNFLNIFKKKLFIDKDPLVEFFSHCTKGKKIFHLKKNKHYKNQNILKFLKEETFFQNNLRKFFFKFGFSRILQEEAKNYFFDFFYKISFVKNLNFFLGIFHIIRLINFFFSQKKNQKFLIKKRKKLFFYEFFGKLIFSKNKTFFSTAKGPVCSKTRKNFTNFIAISFSNLMILNLFRFSNIIFSAFETNNCILKKFMINYLIIFNLVNFNLKKTDFLKKFLFSFFWFFLKKLTLFWTKNSINFIYILFLKNDSGDFLISFTINISTILIKFFKKDENFFFKLFFKINYLNLRKKFLFYRKKKIMRIIIYNFENLLKNKFFFEKTKNFHETFSFSFNFFLQEKKIDLIFFKKKKVIKKKKNYHKKNIYFVMIIGKFLETGFLKPKSIIFFFLLNLQLLFKTKFFLKKKQGKKKILEIMLFFFIVWSKQSPVIFIVFLKYLKKKNIFKIENLMIYGIFLVQITYLFKISCYYKITEKNSLNFFSKIKFFFLTSFYLKNFFMKKSKFKCNNKIILLFFYFIKIIFEIFLIQKKNFIIYISLIEFYFKKFLRNIKCLEIFNLKIIVNFSIKLKKKQLLFWININRKMIIKQKNPTQFFIWILKGLYFNQYMAKKNVEIFFHKIFNVLLFFLSKIFTKQKLLKENYQKKKKYIFKIFFVFGCFFSYFKKIIFLRLLINFFNKIHFSNLFFVYQFLSEFIKGFRKIKKFNKFLFFIGKNLFKIVKYNINKKKKNNKYLQIKLYFLKKIFFLIFQYSSKILRKLFVCNFLRFFINFFFYGITQYIEIFLYMTKIFLSFNHFLNKKLQFYFFNIYFYQLLYYIKFFPNYKLKEKKWVSEFIAILIIKFPNEFILLNKKKIKLFYSIFIKYINSIDKNIQIIGIKILNTLIAIKNFGPELTDIMFFLVFLYLNTYSFLIRKKSIDIISTYFGKKKQSLKNFKLGFLFFFRALNLPFFPLKFIFSEIFVKLIINSTNVTVNFFSKIIFSVVSARLFIEKNLVIRYMSVFTFKMVFLKINITNFLEIGNGINKNIKKKKINWNFFRFIFYSNLFLISYIREYSMIVVKNIFVNIFLSSSLKPFLEILTFSEINYFHFFMYNHIFQKIKWISSLSFPIIIIKDFFLNKNFTFSFNFEFFLFFILDIYIYEIFNNKILLFFFLIKFPKKIFFFWYQKKKKKKFFHIFKNFYDLLVILGLNFPLARINFRRKKLNFLFSLYQKKKIINRKKILKKFAFWILLLSSLKVKLKNNFIFSVSFSLNNFIFCPRKSLFIFKFNFQKKRKFYQRFFLKKFQNLIEHLIR